MELPIPPTRRAYSSDLRDGERALLEPFVPGVKSGGSPARHSPREIVNAILYVVGGGNQWRALPHDLSPWQAAYYFFPHLAQRRDLGADAQRDSHAGASPVGTRGEPTRGDSR